LHGGKVVGRLEPYRLLPNARKKESEDKVRTFAGAAGIAGVLFIAACTGSESVVDENFIKDLELARAASPITLQASPATAQVVSSIERTAPSPRRVAPSQRAVKHTPAPRRTPAPVEIEQPSVAAEPEPEPIEVAEAPTEIPAEVPQIPSARPQPVASPGTGSGGYGDGDIGRGRGDGIGTVIAVVLRGGHAGVDDCDPRVDGRRRGGSIAINNRIPVIGTFPGRGTFPGTGRMTASLPRSGRVRF
jgi:hypothetical protein